MKEKISFRRTVSLIIILISLLLLSGALCLIGNFYPDEWICIFYIDIIFYLLLIFELEYERLRKQIANNTKTDFFKLAIGFLGNCILIGGFAFLPVYCRPVIFVAIIMCFAGNEYLGFICGTFFSILLSVTVSGDYYELVSEMTLVIVGSILAKALKDKKLNKFVYILTVCLNIVIPNIFYYMSDKEFSMKIIMYGGIIGILSAVVAFICSNSIKVMSDDEINDILIDIITDTYPEVAEVKKYSMTEYKHADFVSTIAFRAAKAADLDANLCAAAGFYYRLGQWQGKPYVENGVLRAERLCFPEKLINILQEYYGEEVKPQSPESALVNMVDSLVVKLDKIKQEVGQSEWNHEIIIVQLLNELSESGLYDESGLSMNHFLKIRKYLTKEELLK